MDPIVLYAKRASASLFYITCEERGVVQELQDFFTFDVPGAKYSPLYKARKWDGKTRLFETKTGLFPAGLAPYLRSFCRERGYTYKEETHAGQRYLHVPTIDEVQEFCSSLNIHSNGKPLELRDYQVETVYEALKKKTLVAISPTSSGKSVIIYCYIRWLLQQEKKCLILVPTTALVTQMLSDFKDYSSHDPSGWRAEEACQMLYSGKPKDVQHTQVLISTWQSVHAMSKDRHNTEFYQLWNVYIGDEAHRFAGSSLLTISKKLTNAWYRLGTTGTLQDELSTKLWIEGSFGLSHKVTTTKALMKEGHVVPLKIKCVCINHDKEAKDLFLRNKDYKTEIDYLVTHQKRNKFIANLALHCKGNTLVLFNYVDMQGKVLFSLIEGNDKPAYYISGETHTDVREEIRKQLETHNNAILVASYATVATGINIPSIENIIFASPSKSKIRNLQSIGRGLRLKEGKNFCTIYDISDNLAYEKAKMNYGMVHLIDRMKIYKSEGFDWSRVVIDL